MAIFPKHTLTIKEAWITSLQLYGKTFSQVWYLALGAGIVAAVCSYYFNLGSKISIILCIVATFLVDIYLKPLILCLTYNIGNEQSNSLKNSVSYTNKRYIKLVTNALFMLVVLYVVVFIFCLVSGIFGSLMIISIPKLAGWVSAGIEAVKTNNPIAMGLIAIYVGLPLSFAYILFLVAQSLILFDNQGAWSSITGGYKLIRNNWWRSFMIFFPCQIVPIIGTIGTTVGRQMLSEYKWYTIGAALLIKVLLDPAALAFMLVLFNDLKLRKNKDSMAATETK